MKKVKRFLMVMGLGVSLLGTFSTDVWGQYQLPNSGFEEEWFAVSKGKETLGWHSFGTVQGVMAFAAKAEQLYPETVEVKSGKYSAKIQARWASITCANGNLTTGQVMANSWTATDLSNHNSSGPSFGSSQKFQGKPDLLTVWVKFVPGNSANESRVSAIIHGNSDYCDPEDKKYDNVVAKAQVNYTATSDNGWQQLQVPFDYSSYIINNQIPAYLLLTFTTNKTPGKGNPSSSKDANKDIVYIDDIEMIYNSQLSSLTYDGATIPNFAIDNHNTLDLSSVQYDASKLAYISNGVGANVETAFNNATGLLTITVKGDDISVNAENKHVYKVQFAIPPVDVTPIVGAYPSALSVNPFGSLSPIISQSITLAKGSKDGVVNLSIQNFMFMGAPIGNINMIDIPVSLNNGVYILERNTQNVFLEGLGGELPIELVAASISTNSELTVSLSIDLKGAFVTVGVYPFTVEGVADLKVTGHVSKEASKVLLVDTESVYTSLDLSAATIDADVTYADLSTNLTQSDNLLIYVPANSTITGTNVIVGTKASSIALTDKVPFNAPKAFTADAITYTRNCYTDGGWETIALPFAVSNVSGEYKLEKFKNSDNTKVNFETATTWEANTAYLFSLKGDGTNVDCTFTGSGSIEPAMWAGKFRGVYETTDAVGKYLMGQDGKSFVLGVTEGSNSAHVEPFRAYLDETAVPNKAPSYTIGHDGGATGVVVPEVINTIYVSGSTIVVNSNEAMTINVYDVVGKLVRTVALNEGENTIGGLPSGFYVVNGQKVVIK